VVCPKVLFHKVVTRIKKACDFFLTPRGCSKGNACDFAHVGPQVPDPFAMYGMQGMHGMHGMQGMMGGGGRGGMPGGMFSGMAAAHMMGGGGRGGRGGGAGLQFGIGRGGMLVPKRPKACEFFNTERGCVKGERCDFIHQKEKICDFYLTDRGCRKGKFCDFKHPEKDGKDGGTPGEDGPRNIVKTDKVCAFYLGERGCRKGKSCDFLHPENDEDEVDKEKKKESTRYKPY